MAVVNVVRVNALPDPLAANTIYFVASGANGLQTVVTGNDASVVKSGLTSGQVQGLIDSSITSATSSIQADVDTKIATAINGLDLTNVAEIVDDIAARDALTPTKNIFVLVVDASADATVEAGAALYFYIFDDETYVKVSEYESMDVIIPNKSILQDLGDDNGLLTYKGAAVGTVLAGTMEW